MYLIKNKFFLVFIIILLTFIVINLDYSVNNRNYLNQYNQKSKFSIELIKKDGEFSYFKMTDRCVLLPFNESRPKLQGFGTGFNNFADINDDYLKVTYPYIKRDESGVFISELKIKNNQEVTIKLNCNIYALPITNIVYIINNSNILN